MASATFHPFSRLPTELRLQIWEAACFPFQERPRSVHFVELSDLGDYTTKTHPVKPKVSESGQIRHEDINPSAYMWDFGLQTACKESREVITRHLGTDDMFQYPVEVQEANTRYHRLRREKLDNRAKLACLNNHVDNHEQRCIVRPAHDILCIRMQNCELPPGGLDILKLYIPSLRGNSSCRKVENIAFEFNPSWNLDMVRNDFQWSNLAQDNSPSAMLARALFDAVYTESTSSSPQIWIIDKHTPWVRDPGQDLDTVYHDCEDAYVEIGWDNTRLNTTCNMTSGHVTTFIEELSFLGQDAYMSHLCRGSKYPWEISVQYFGVPLFVAKDHVKLLVRRDNEVKGFAEEYNNYEDSDGESYCCTDSDSG
ncbi:hypothetical protein ACHAPU_009456 [Fusarium lateritium]